MAEQKCANCAKWTPDDSSDVLGYLDSLQDKVVEDTPIELVEGLESDETALSLTRGTQSCSWGRSGIYGENPCDVPSEFIAIDSIQTRG